MPLPTSTNVSVETRDSPLASSCAPAATIELAQPRHAPPELPHGHAVPEPSPKQNEVPAEPASRSRTKTSSKLFVSPATRFEALLRNATCRPSAEIEGYVL